MSIANALTVSRLLSVPLIVMLIREQQFATAALLFAAAGLTDALDGYLARRLGQCSEVGAYLDALADKCLVAACFIALHLAGLVPLWLLVLVLAREVVIVGAVGVAFALGKPYPIGPLMVSKANTAAQLTLLAATLAVAGFGVPAGAQVLATQGVWALQLLVAALTSLSLAAYFAAWCRHMTA